MGIWPFTAEFPGLRPKRFAPRVAPLATRSLASSARRGDGRLWVIALGLSLLVNAGILLILGLASLDSRALRKVRPASPPAAASTTVIIVPGIATASPNPVAATPVPASGKPRFARTDEAQTAAAPETSARIGERNTRATSNRNPEVTAPPLPSQAGIEPEDREDLETTESDYQDGRLTDGQAATPPSPMPTPAPDPEFAENQSPGEKAETPGKDDSKSSPPARQRLIAGPNPVDVPVPRDVAENPVNQPSPLKSPQPEKPAPSPEASPKPVAAKPASDPGFRGYQRKAAIVGSISRTGRSALDVADSPLGRYQAVISRAVEQEWQRNCVRHRDFITPGFLTLRFFVETSGRVRTVQFVGDMASGEVQKGFTLNAIRDADIPAMSAALKKDFEKEPLELIFNFYF